MQIAAVGTSLPPHYYDQETLISVLKTLWATRHHNVDRLESIHRNALIGGRHLALPLEEYEALESFGKANDAFIRCATDLGAEAIAKALAAAALSQGDVDHLFFVSTTGVATPSIDARILNRTALRADVKRTPIFGLGCAGGAAGVARAADYLRGLPDQVAVVLSVELCTLTLQREDLSIPNIIASGLFGDGAAAVVLVGANRKAKGPRVLASRSFFYRDTERLMGWDVTSEGFRIVLSGDIPAVVREHARRNVDEFLAANDLTRRHIGRYVCHAGGPRVLEAFEEALELPEAALAPTWRCLKEVGNLSSASVLFVLEDILRGPRPEAGTFGLMLALGPGFCAELVLLRW